MTSDALSNESNRESNGAAGSTANRNVSIDPAAFAWVRCLTQRVELGCPRPARISTATGMVIDVAGTGFGLCTVTRSCGSYRPLSMPWASLR